MVTRRLCVVFVSLIAGAVIVGPGTARAGSNTWFYPSGSAPCNTTLQACLDAASSGDEVLLETDTLINEQARIQDKTLTLAAGPGYTPEIASLIVRTTTAVAGPIGVLVEHVQVQSTLFVQLNGGTGTQVILDHVTAQSSGADPGIYGIIYVGSTVTVENSSVTQNGFYPGIELSSNNANQQALVWNVTNNTITGELASEAQAGIYLSATNASSVTSNVYNNSIWDEGQGVNDGDHGGIVLFVRESGNARFNIVGNSVDRVHGDGLVADNEQQSPHTFAIYAYDNIIANTSVSAVRLVNEPGTTGPFVIHGGSNDLHANGDKNHLHGNTIGTYLTAAPKFVNEHNGDLQLKASSPLIDKGITCSPGGVGGPDAAGRSRIHGSNVDIGAYEFDAGAGGIVEVGTSGPDTLYDGAHDDILCGYGGNDTLYGTNGNDFLSGGPGNDRIYSLGGHDRLFGDSGNDLLCAKDASGGDYLNGGSGIDSYRADPSDTVVSVEKKGHCSI